MELAAFGIDIVLVHLKRGGWVLDFLQEFNFYLNGFHVKICLVRKNIHLVGKDEEFLLLSKSNHGLNILSCEHLQKIQF